MAGDIRTTIDQSRGELLAANRDRLPEDAGIGIDAETRTGWNLDVALLVTLKPKPSAMPSAIAAKTVLRSSVFSSR
jgi:hypothetical protein